MKFYCNFLGPSNPHEANEIKLRNQVKMIKRKPWKIYWTALSRLKDRAS